jgi:hypothetical protein
VKRYRGTYGVDKMDTDALLPYLLEHKESLAASLYSGTYRPNPVRQVEILIQQAINQVLSPIYEMGASMIIKQVSDN